MRLIYKFNFVKLILSICTEIFKKKNIINDKIAY